jgi:hypothetical protein
VATRPSLRASTTGFGDLFIRAKNQIDYSLFHTSRKVFIGSANWLFLREHADELVSVERSGDRWRLDVYTKLLTVARYLHKQGILFVVLDVPEKSNVYPAMIPTDMPRRSTVTSFDKLGEQLAASGEARPSARNVLLLAASIIFYAGGRREQYPGYRTRPECWRDRARFPRKACASDRGSL